MMMVIVIVRVKEQCSYLAVGLGCSYVSCNSSNINQASNMVNHKIENHVLKACIAFQVHYVAALEDAAQTPLITPSKMR